MEDHKAAGPVHEWINRELAQCDPLHHDKALADLLASLQVRAKELRDSVADLSDALVAVVPDTGKGVESLRAQCGSTARGLASSLHSFALIDDNTLSTVAELSKIDKIKTRMQTCAHKLHEIDQWNKRVSQLPIIFETKDIDKISGELFQMKRSLEVLEVLPKHPQRKETLFKFEADLEALAAESLAKSLEKDDFDAFSKFALAFVKLERSAYVKATYVSSRLERLKIIWSSLFASVASFASSGKAWPYNLFEDLVASLSQDRTRLQSSSLPINLKISFFDELLSSSLKELFDPFFTALSLFSKQNLRKARSLVVVNIQIWNSFVTQIINLSTENVKKFSPDTIESLQAAHLLKLGTSPIFRFMDDFVSFQKQVFLSFIDEFKGPLKSDDSVFSLDSLISSVCGDYERVIEHFSVEVDESLNFCIFVSQGFHSPELQTSFVEFVRELCFHLSKVFMKVRKFSKIEEFAKLDDKSISAEIQWKLVDFFFFVHRQTSAFKSSAGVSIETARTRLLSCVNALLDLDDGKEFNEGFEPSPFLRVFKDLQPERLASLQKFVSDSDALTRISSSFDSLLSQVVDSVIQALCYKEKCILFGMSSWEIWQAPEKKSFLLSPASFSTPPSEAITLFGDELVSIAQQLEVHTSSTKTLGGTEASSESELTIDMDAVMYWLEKVVQSLSILLLERIQEIPVLSSKGGKQLESDLSYIIGVIQMLGIPELSALQACREASVAPADQLKVLIEKFPDSEALIKRIFQVKKSDK